MAIIDRLRPIPDEITFPRNRIGRRTSALAASVFLGGVVASGGIGGNSDSPERTDSGEVTGKTLDWGGSTQSNYSVNIAGFTIFSDTSTKIDDPDFMLTLKNCEKGPTACIENPVFVSEELFTVTNVGDFVDFSENTSVSFEDPLIEG